MKEQNHMLQQYFDMTIKKKYICVKKVDKI